MSTRTVDNPKEHIAMKTPSIVSHQEWEAARQKLLVKEKAFTPGTTDSQPAFQNGA